MKTAIRKLLVKLWKLTTPAKAPVDHSEENAALREIVGQMLARLTPDESHAFTRFRDLASDLIEARLMSGSGPMMQFPGRKLLAEANRTLLRIQECALAGLRNQTVELQEASGMQAIGAFGDIELALQNIDWRREINMSWLEFSRWGIQQIILMSRLYYVKQPLMRRAVDVVAAYVFGRGVEVSSTDDDANDVLNEFYDRNRATFGSIGRLCSQRALSTDGNLFFAFFSDPINTGKVTARRIEATEIQEVITDPDDSDTEWFFKRVWTAKKFDIASGATSQATQTCWYPALNYEKPAGAPDRIGADAIMWDTPVLHGKHGAVAKWNFGCPEGFPALEWIKTAARYMQSCATLAASHAQIAWDVTTKGGQAAVEGTKEQIQTTVNATGSPGAWDTNPAAVTGSVLAKGPGTEWKMVNSRGQGLDPKEGLTYNVYVGNVFGIPPTWLGDMETSNLSTATTLDRPTELGMRARQMWWEDFETQIATFILKVSAGAANGMLRERLETRKISKIVCMEAPRKTLPDGRRIYDEAAKPKPGEIHVRVTFPAIREGDMPAIIKAIAEAMTLDNKGGQIVGIDEREGVRMMYETLGQEDPEVILDQQYPLKAKGVKGTPGYTPAYDPNRTKVPLPAPIGKALPPPGGQPQLPGGEQPEVAGVGGPAPQDKPVTAVASESYVRRGSKWYTQEGVLVTFSDEESLGEKLARLVEAVRSKAA